MYVLNSEENDLFRSFLGNFLIPQEQRICKTCVQSFVNRAIHLFPKKNKVLSLHLIDLVVSNFYFDLVPQLYFLK